MAATNDANTAIKNRLAAMAQFHPATVNLFDGWLLDPGDIVTVSSGEDDYNVPVYSMDVTWKGSSRTEIQSTGSEKRPPLSALRRNSYATGRRQAEDEAELIRHDADIEKSKERILLWATEEEWNEIEEQWQLTHKSELEVINNAINARVTQTSLNTTLQGYLTLTANQTILGNVMDQDGKVTAASIATAINTQTGTGIVTIDADMVNITGTTTIGDVMSYGNSNLYVKGDIYAMTPGGSYHALAGNMVVPSNCGLFFATGSSTNVNVYASDMSNLMESLADAQVVADGNNYKLQVKYIGDTGWTDAGTFSRATAPTIGGSWNGSGTYTITSNPSAAAGSKLTVTPTIRLNGSGGTSFSAEMLNDSSSPTVERSVTGYLHQSGNSVNVYKTYSGGTYSDIIASVSVSGSTPLNDDCRLTNFTWHSSGSVAGKTVLSTLSSLINSHKNDRGYIFLEGYVVGGTGPNREYYITIGTV